MKIMRHTALSLSTQSALHHGDYWSLLLISTFIMIPDSVDKGEEHVLNSTYHLLSDPELCWHLYKDIEDIQCLGFYHYLRNKFPKHNTTTMTTTPT